MVSSRASFPCVLSSFIASFSSRINLSTFSGLTARTEFYRKFPTKMSKQYLLFTVLQGVSIRPHTLTQLHFKAKYRVARPMRRLAVSVLSIFFNLLLIPRSISGIPFNIWAESRPSSLWTFEETLYFWGRSYKCLGSTISSNFAFFVSLPSFITKQMW